MAVAAAATAPEPLGGVAAHAAIWKRDRACLSAAWAFYACDERICADLSIADFLREIMLGILEDRDGIE